LAVWGQWVSGRFDWANRGGTEQPRVSAFKNKLLHQKERAKTSLDKNKNVKAEGCKKRERGK